MKNYLLLALMILLLASQLSPRTTRWAKTNSPYGAEFPPIPIRLSRAPAGQQNARFGIVAFRYARRFNFSDNVNVKYTADVVPAAFLNYPDLDITVA